MRLKYSGFPYAQFTFSRSDKISRANRDSRVRGLWRKFNARERDPLSLDILQLVSLTYFLRAVVIVDTRLTYCTTLSRGPSRDTIVAKWFALECRPLIRLEAGCETHLTPDADPAPTQSRSRFVRFRRILIHCRWILVPLFSPTLRFLFSSFSFKNGCGGETISSRNTSSQFSTQCFSLSIRVI